MPQHHWHLTTEQLSAFLDQQLSAQEQATCQTHMDDCELCQQQRAALAQTILLVRALPRAPLPRSFVLPIETPATSTIQSKAIAKKEQPMLITTRQTRNRLVILSSYMRTPMRLASTLVAIIGMFFILSGSLSIISPMNGHTTQIASVSLNNKVEVPPVAPPAALTNKAAVPPAALTNNVAIPPAAIKPVKKIKTHQPGSSLRVPQQPSRIFPSIPFLDLSRPEGRLGVGLLLFMVGIVSLKMLPRPGTIQE